MRKIVVAIVVFVILLYALLFPPRFLLNITKRVEPSVETGEALVNKYECRSCHRMGGKGSLKAPDLRGITLNPKDPALVNLRIWLRNPKAIRSNTAMPNFHLSDSEIEAIITYLRSLDIKDESSH